MAPTGRRPNSKFRVLSSAFYTLSPTFSFELSALLPPSLRGVGLYSPYGPEAAIQNSKSKIGKSRLSNSASRPPHLLSQIVKNTPFIRRLCALLGLLPNHRLHYLLFQVLNKSHRGGPTFHYSNIPGFSSRRWP
jgi:hypothetical protein